MRHWLDWNFARQKINKDLNHKRSRRAVAPGGSIWQNCLSLRHQKNRPLDHLNFYWRHQRQVSWDYNNTEQTKNNVSWILIELDTMLEIERRKSECVAILTIVSLDTWTWNRSESIPLLYSVWKPYSNDFHKFLVERKTKWCIHHHLLPVLNINHVESLVGSALVWWFGVTLTHVDLYNRQPLCYDICIFIHILSSLTKLPLFPISFSINAQWSMYSIKQIWKHINNARCKTWTQRLFDVIHLFDQSTDWLII